MVLPCCQRFIDNWKYFVVLFSAFQYFFLVYVSYNFNTKFFFQDFSYSLCACQHSFSVCCRCKLRVLILGLCLTYLSLEYHYWLQQLFMTFNECIHKFASVKFAPQRLIFYLLICAVCEANEKCLQSVLTASKAISHLVENYILTASKTIFHSLASLGFPVLNSFFVFICLVLEHKLEWTSY